MIPGALGTRMGSQVKQENCLGDMEEGLRALKPEVFGERILEAQGFPSPKTKSPLSLPDNWPAGSNSSYGLGSALTNSSYGLGACPSLEWLRGAGPQNGAFSFVVPIHQPVSGPTVPEAFSLAVSPH